MFNLTGLSNPVVMVSGALYNGIIASASVPPGPPQEQLRVLDAVAENGAAREQAIRP